MDNKASVTRRMIGGVGLVGITASAAVGLGVSPASAYTFNLISDPVKIKIVTDNNLTTDPSTLFNGYLITSLSGKVGTEPVTLLPPKGSFVGWTTNNLFNPNSPSFDIHGVSFRNSTDTTQYHLYYDNPTYHFVSCSKTGLCFGTIVEDFTVVPVPEPLTLLAAGTALGFVPLLKREYSRKQQKEKAKV